MLWTCEALLAATNGRPVGDLPVGVTGISIDTRTLAAGDAFFAIKGDQFDGHDFIGAAMKAGAAVAIVGEDKLVALGRWNLPMIVVRDVLEAMVLLGRAARQRTAAQILAITGSAGKTSAKEMMRRALDACGSVHASVASFNNHWGVPLTLARMPENTEYGVFEIGMNHAGEIEPLVDMVKPHVALITNVEAAHIGAFNSVAEIARAKAEIFTGVVPGGYAVINLDNRYQKLLHKLATEAGIDHIYTFGRKKGADFHIETVEPQETGSTAVISIRQDAHPLSLAMPGEHMIANAAAVLGAISLIGADLGKAIPALARMQPEKGRGQRFTLPSATGSFTLIDESFNANPASMRAGLALLASCPVGADGRRIAVLGDMLEMGSSSKKLHGELAKPVVESNADLVFLVGEDMAHLKDNLPEGLLGGYFKSAAEMESKLIDTLRGGDAVMLKASKGLKFMPLVEKLVEYFEGTANN